MDRTLRPAVAASWLGLALALLVLSSCRFGPSEAPEGQAEAEREDGRSIRLLFTYGSEKEGWVEEVTEGFNARRVTTASGKRIRVEAVPQGSGEAIDDILSGARKAHLTSPASGAFLELGNAESRAKTGRDLIGETRNLVLSPVVVAMWKPMAEAIGWGRRPVGWADILTLARDPRGWAAHGHPEWGPFRLGHTHPEYSNSGLIAVLAEVYAGAGKVAGLTAEDVARPETASFVAGIESAIVHYGSSTGFFGKRMFESGPQYLSAAVLYENMVIESTSGEYGLPFPVIAIYPKEGTFWSDHPVGIVDREWVTPEHREAAEAYIAYLLARPQQERAMAMGFRPADVDIPLGSPFDRAHGVDPNEPQTTLEVPPVEVIDAALALWSDNKKRSDVTLVLDVSGSMNDDRKIVHAREGAEQLVAMLDDEDLFSLLPFSDQPRWAFQGTRMETSRDKAVETVRGLFADGGTALYDAVAAAHEHQIQALAADPGRIAAIVVLSDGRDTDSNLSLEALLGTIRADSEARGVRVFTIAYGDDAETEVLERIADATRARSYKGTPQNIRTVFREISTFF